MDDKALKKLVQAELDWEPSVEASDIGVIVDKGIVDLVDSIDIDDRRHPRCQ